MKKKLPWQMFFSILSIIVIIFTCLLSWDLFSYNQLKSHVSVDQIHATIKELGSNRFSIELDYLYEVNNVKYSSKNELKNFIYKNTSLAAQKASSLATENVQVWFNPKKPYLGIINKSFPFKRFFSTITLWAILIYFYLLNRYISKKI